MWRKLEEKNDYIQIIFRDFDIQSLMTFLSGRLLWTIELLASLKNVLLFHISHLHPNTQSLLSFILKYKNLINDNALKSHVLAQITRYVVINIEKRKFKLIFWCTEDSD